MSDAVLEAIRYDCHTVLMPESFLVTGARGCIGAWIIRKLVEESVPVVADDSRSLDTRAQTFNIPCKRANMTDMVAAIEAAAPAVAGQITLNDREFSFAVELEADGLERTIGPVELSPLPDGVRQTFRSSAR